MDSIQHFRAQIHPIVSHLVTQGIAQFIQGQYQVTPCPAPDFEESFGPRPLYRLVDFYGLHDASNIGSRYIRHPVCIICVNC